MRSSPIEEIASGGAASGVITNSFS
jgi:hypothetical protein